jgi:hypothetical protein
MLNPKPQKHNLGNIHDKDSARALISVLNFSKFCFVFFAPRPPSFIVKPKRPVKVSSWTSVVPPGVFPLGLK